ncbi:MAG: hypothetical protein K1000chlam3_01586, partial [Chlamydiae bacterium]|nr:hypothetical protein [Chlamydiota bacterium]
MYNLIAFIKICLVCHHPGAATHFAEFAKVFEENAVPYELYTDHKDLDELAANSHHFSAIIVDIAPQSEEVLELFQTLGKKTYVYYDNPEEFVPGGYSETANKLRAIANKTLFANANLATEETDIGIGYSPVVNDVLEIQKMRETSDRAAFLKKHEIEDTGQKIIVYFGGANDTYYTQAFPHFLDLLKEWDFSNTVFIHQQHPRAFKEGNRDGKLLKEKMPQIVLSKVNNKEALAIADVALYYQTSMSPLFYLSGVPTFQVGHESYLDVLIRTGLCRSITKHDEISQILSAPQIAIDEQKIYAEIGY